MAAKGAIKAGDAYVRIYADEAALTRSLKSVKAKLLSFSATVGAVGRSMMTTGVIAAAPFALAGRTFAGFADQMATVKAVTQAAEREFDKLYNKAKLLGRTTSYTAKQVSEGMTELGRAGFKPKEIDAAIASILALARGTDTELAEAAQIGANALRGFNMQAEDTEYVADLLSATANNSAQNLVDIGEALKYIAPLANSAGEDIRDVAAAIGVMANNGIRGSMAGTSLARAYVNLSKSAKQKKLKDMLGIDSVDKESGNLKKMATLLVEIGQKTKNLGSAAKLDIFNELFGRGQAASLKLAQGSNFDDMIKVLSEVDGVAKATAKTMDATLGGSFRMMMSAVEGTQIALGEAVSGELSAWMDKVAMVAGVSSVWIADNKKLVISVIKLTAGLIGMGGALIGIAGAAKGLAFAFGGISTAHTVFGKAQTAAASLLTGLSAIPGSISKISARYSIFSACLQTQTALAGRTVAAQTLLKAANLSTASSANMAAAKISLLSRAEIEATIRAKIFAATQASVAAKTKALTILQSAALWVKGLSAASIAAVAQMRILSIATSAQAATTAKLSIIAQAIAWIKNLSTASLIAAAKVKVLTVAQIAQSASLRSFSAITGAVALVKSLSLAQVAASAKTVIATVVNKAFSATLPIMSIGLKGASAGFLAMSAAIVATPIGWIVAGLAAVGAAIGGVVYLLDREKKHIAEVSDEMKKMRQAGDDTRKTDMMRMRRLEQLSKKQSLNNDEQKEANKLLSTLQGRYGDLGLSINKTTGALEGMTEAQKKLSTAMRDAAKAELEAEQMELQNNIDERNSEINYRGGSYWKATGEALWLGNNSDEIKKLSKRNEVDFKRIMAVRKRLKALSDAEVNVDNLTGKDEKEVLQESIAKGEQEALTAEQAQEEAIRKIEDAEKALSRIRADEARKRRSELENEIYDIKQAASEYKKLLETVLQAEQQKTDANSERIAKLKKELDGIDGITESRIADAQHSAIEDMESQLRDTVSGFSERREKSAEDERIEEALKADKEGGVALIKTLLAQAKQESKQAQEEAQRTIDQSKVNGNVDEGGQNSVAAAIESISKSESRVDELMAKLKNAGVGIGESEVAASDGVGTKGSFSAMRMLAFASGGGAEDRTATATEAIKRNGEKTNKLLKEGLDSKSGAFFV